MKFTEIGLLYVIFTVITLFTSCASTSDNTTEEISNECKENKCYNHGICMESGVCYCEDGYEAPYCLNCKEGYMLSPENKCIPPEEGMLYVPATSFKMGCSKALDSLCDETTEKEHDVYLSPFQIDKYEVTVSQYKKCVESNACSKPVGNSVEHMCNYGSFSRLEHPVNCITWQQAKDYCTFVGKKLPTEAQWELAATGSKKSRIYPWGNKTPNCEYAVMYDKSSGCNLGRTSIVGSKANGKSVYGVYDLIGNVWEWCEDYYDRDFYSNSPENNPVNENTGKYKVVRGGGFDLKNLTTLRNKYRGFAVSLKSSPSIGFRCVK